MPASMRTGWPACTDTRTMKADPRRLELSLYPAVAEVPPRFGDMDALRHLNNVSLAGIYEEARVILHRRAGAEAAREKGTRTVIGQVQITYLAEAHYPAMLQVGGGVVRIGRTSYLIAQAMFQNGRCVGVADTLIVNTREGRSHPLSEPFRAALQTVFIQLDGADHG